MEKINIAELLKDCPKGMELDCTMWDNVCFVGVAGSAYPIKIETPEGLVPLDKYGCYSSDKHAKCVIFPKGKTTWEGFVPPYKFKDGDIVATMDGGWIGIIKKSLGRSCETYITIYDENIVNNNSVLYFDRLATEEEKQKLFDAIKVNGYNWNAETKTLEKLIKHTFKVGNTIRGKYTGNVYTISHITPTGYKLTDGTSFEFDAEDAFELVHDKFDITTLVPFESKVLVRDWDSYKWLPAVWGFCDNDSKKNYPYYVVGGQCYEYCIPYKGNEHLIGKKDDCDEFYKIWK